VAREGAVKRALRGSFTVLAVLCAAFLVLGLICLPIAYRARDTAEAMRWCQWIGNERCRARVAALPQTTGGFRFAVLGDIQNGATQLPRLMSALEREAPVAFAIQTGDAVSHADPGHYTHFLNQLAHSGLWLPMFVLAGNHDVRGDREDLFGRYFGARRLWFEHGGALFVLLDNSSGKLDDAQYDWLEGVLEDRGGGNQHILLFMHVQPIHWEGDDKRPVEHRYVRLFELSRRYGVDYVFSGNWHGYHREERDGITFVINGRGGDFDSDDRLVPCYFTVVDVGEDSIKDRRVELPPRASLVVRGLLTDSLIAHVGDSAVANPWGTGFVLSLAGAGCVAFLRLRRYL
jgi:hypothetical protein